jgi:hypothetical protein
VPWPEGRRPDNPLRLGLVAGALAAVLGGAPSTLYALTRGSNLTEATRAAGALLGRPTIIRGVFAHGALSLLWGVVLAVALPPRHRVAGGALAGLGIAAFDLGVVGRRVPAIRALPQGPQWADHVAFGATAGAVLAHMDRAGR